MIEKNLIVRGKVLRFGANYFSPQAAMAKSHPHLHYPGFRIQHAVPTTMRDDPGRSLFQWLAYIPGVVNQVPLGAQDILSGMFSGCWMAVYQVGGRQYVGHIGTEDNPNSAHSLAAKQAWRNFSRAQGVNPAPFIAFQPHIVALTDPSIPKLIDGTAQDRYLGLVTTERKCFSVLLLGVGPDTWRVAAVRQQQPRGGLANLFP
ncbi:MAG: hypothetical protein FJZ88_04230 [Chloroflexi bacterium]|nr:hypothetical protein [Chloroflexota bacterium]